MRVFTLLLITAGYCIACANADIAGNDYTLYLVRHAEKQADGSRDPKLTGAGITRSRKLADWFVNKDLEDIWSSDYFRTRDTAAPLLLRPGQSVMIYDPSDLPGLAKDLSGRQRTALVVGHSNTTPQLARLLCNCSIADMDESEYDRLIVITTKNGKTTTKTLDQSKL